MPKIYEAGGYAVVIWTNESKHRVPHVHVVCGNGCQAIALGDSKEPPRLLGPIGMRRHEARRALQIVCEHQEEFIARWKGIHGNE
jgi:hypothetical protein